MAIADRCLAVLKHAEQCKSYRGDIQVVQQPVSANAGASKSPWQESAQGGRGAAGRLPATDHSNKGRKRKNHRGRH